MELSSKALDEVSSRPRLSTNESLAPASRVLLAPAAAQWALRRWPQPTGARGGRGQPIRSEDGEWWPADSWPGPGVTSSVRGQILWHWCKKGHKPLFFISSLNVYFQCKAENIKWSSWDKISVEVDQHHHSPKGLLCVFISQFQPNWWFEKASHGISLYTSIAILCPVSFCSYYWGLLAPPWPIEALLVVGCAVNCGC